MLNEFLHELKEKDIIITFSRGKIQYRGPEQYINEELISRLKKNKSKLVEHFWPRECPNIIPYNTEGDLRPLVLLHAGEYFKISEFLGNRHPYYGLFYIGSESEKIRYKTVEAFADEYLKQLLNILPEGPFYLGGMSFGGIVAYEMAIRLVNMGYEVPLLIIGDAGLLAYQDPYYYRLSKSLVRRCYHLMRYIFERVDYYREKFKFELFPSVYFSLTVKRRVRYMIRRYTELSLKYKPTTEFKGEILLFRASENTCNPKYMGWERVCKNITLVPFNGFHGSLFEDNTGSINIIKTHIRDKLSEFENIKNSSSGNLTH